MQTMKIQLFFTDAATIRLPIEPMTGEAVSWPFATPKSTVERAKFVQN